MLHQYSPSISIVIPSVSPISNSPILAAWNALPEFPYHVQFVFLVNQKHPSHQPGSSRHQYTTHEVIEVLNDRYFGTCEENIERAVDFVDELATIILLVGEHDSIDWQELRHAIEFFQDNKLDALAINIKCCQKRPSGDFFALDALVRPAGHDSSHQCVQSLFDGNWMSSQSAFPALISCMGPIDWAAYIGSHIYSREAFRRMLMYRYSEHVYSFVYRQLLLFTSIPCRYALYAGTPIHRISDDFLKISNGEHSLGWLENHRTVRGLSPCFWIAHLQYLNEINESTLFKLVTYSQCLSIQASSDHTCVYARGPVLAYILYWCESVLRNRLSGKSHYMPESALPGHCGDLRSIYLYLGHLYSNALEDKILRTLHGSRFLRDIDSAHVCIGTYLQSLQREPSTLSPALARLESARLSLNAPSHADQLPQYGFAQYEKLFAQRQKQSSLLLRRSNVNNLRLSRLRLVEKLGRTIDKAKYCITCKIA